MSDDWDAPLSAGTCPWCSATNPPDARQCRSCGAAIAQRDDLGGVQVPGVTGVDPNLLGTQRSLASPMLRSQGTMGAINAVSQVNATLGLATAAAILGQDTLKGMLGLKDADLASVGKASEAALQAAERLDRGEAPTDGSEAAAPPPPTDPWGDLPASTGAAPSSDPWMDRLGVPGSIDPTSDAPAPPAASEPADPWSDLPAVVDAPTVPDPWSDLPAVTDEPAAPDPWSDLPAG